MEFRCTSIQISKALHLQVCPLGQRLYGAESCRFSSLSYSPRVAESNLEVLLCRDYLHLLWKVRSLPDYIYEFESKVMVRTTTQPLCRRGSGKTTIRMEVSSSFQSKLWIRSFTDPMICMQMPDLCPIASALPIIRDHFACRCRQPTMNTTLRPSL